MKPTSVALACSLVAQLTCPQPVLAQGGGDQFLDGIGETALVARYVFSGNARDASRNTHHATRLLLDKTLERQDWHETHAAECARDVRFYQAALAYHTEQARRARRIRAELERLVM